MPKAKRLPSGAYRTQVYAGKDENGKNQFTQENSAENNPGRILSFKYRLWNILEIFSELTCI